MNTMLKHAKLAIRMDNIGIKMENIKENTIREIINCCDRIEKSEILNDEYKDDILIQREMIRDDKFLPYYNKLFENSISIDKFKELLEQIKEDNKKVSDFSIQNILEVLSNDNLRTKAYYDYLKYFCNENISIRDKITNNLNHFHSQDIVKLNKLSSNQIELLKIMNLDNYNLIPIENIDSIYRYLADNEDLRKIIEFLNLKKLYIPLNIELYKTINDNAKDVYNYLKKIEKEISNNELTYQMLLKWVSNDCNIYYLKIISEKINTIDATQLEKVFSNKSNYINFVYGNKLKRFPLENIYGDREELIIYAISNNKNSFLKLIEENMDEFLSIPTNSVLYHKTFYTKYININELTIKHLKHLKSMNHNNNSKIDNLKEQIYTFEEIKTLYEADERYIILYNGLLKLRVDDRLIRIRQFIKKDLLDEYIWDKDKIKTIAEKISIKPLYNWLEDEFNAIKGIKAKDVVRIFMNYDNIEKLLPEISKRSELLYLLANVEKIEDYDYLENIKDDIENFDSYWSKLKDIMNLSNDFIETNKESIREFLLNNGSELAYSYYTNCNKEQQESFKLIIKSELMGKFKTLKYHTDDLEKEIDYKLNKQQIFEWTENNSKIIEGKYDIAEYDDFYHTMILGEYPKHTCLSYKSGAYNKCLLACFDSNKKILYAKINDRIVARAMVRLTKGTFNNKESNKKDLEFFDVESNAKSNIEKNNEYLTMFLELSYVSGISDEEEIKVKKLFIKLLRDKAKRMDALLVLSSNYAREIDEKFISTRYYVYISKSKSSAQYLDSLSGQATVSDEGGYKENTFLIENSLEEKGIKEFQSIFVA